MLGGMGGRMKQPGRVLAEMVRRCASRSRACAKHVFVTFGSFFAREFGSHGVGVALESLVDVLLQPVEQAAQCLLIPGAEPGP